jgi:hypothetical protein
MAMTTSSSIKVNAFLMLAAFQGDVVQNRGALISRDPSVQKGSSAITIRIYRALGSSAARAKISTVPMPCYCLQSSGCT